MKSFHLVALTDGTDEIFNLGYYKITFKEGATAGDAFSRMLLEDYMANWGPGSFDKDFEGYKEWQEGRSWLVSFVDPSEMVELQNEPNRNKHIFGEGPQFLSLESVLIVLDALRKVILPVR